MKEEPVTGVSSFDLKFIYLARAVYTDSLYNNTLQLESSLKCASII